MLRANFFRLDAAQIDDSKLRMLYLVLEILGQSSTLLPMDTLIHKYKSTNGITK